MELTLSCDFVERFVELRKSDDSRIAPSRNDILAFFQITNIRTAEVARATRNHHTTRPPATSRGFPYPLPMTSVSPAATLKLTGDQD
ncbi:unnamed protein product [Haemonchus placei]|uniref:Uncharacterized protein n=1 Tax=Haemonchus placei TaxID=6290 RepID=A0A0N4X2C7_HAEPC|nr:unnamed protein product [Haemonchus placei]